MKVRPILTGFVLTLAAAGGCKTAPTPPPPSEPVVSPAGIKVKDQTLSSFTAVVMVDVENPGRTPLEVESAHYEFSSGDLVLREGDAEIGVSVPPGESTTVAVPVAVEWEPTEEEFGAFLDKASLPLLFEGTLKTSAGELPVSVAGSLRTPRLPRVALGTPDAARQRVDAIAATFRVEIYNDNPFPVRVRRLSYAIEVEGNEVASGELANKVTVPPSAQLVFEVPADLTEETVPGLAQKMKEENRLSYVLRGVLFVGDLEIDVEEPSEIVFTAER